MLTARHPPRLCASMPKCEVFADKAPPYRRSGVLQPLNAGAGRQAGAEKTLGDSPLEWTNADRRRRRIRPDLYNNIVKTVFNIFLK